jgi:Icc-related predicted phosphoesterase
MKEKGIIYLQDEMITINGLIFYGTPWTPNFMNWHFMADEKTLYDIFLNIPKRTDVLITHTPAFSQFDKIKQIRESRPSNVGSKSLKIIKETRLDNLKCHIFGHVHEAYGNDRTNYNVSVLDEKYRMVNKVTEIEI